MSYSGNPSLSKETQDRISNTYGQTLQLAREGRRKEALLGCDFILKMDPLFQPARNLQERLAGGEGPVDVSDLAPPDLAAPAAPPPAASPEPPAVPDASFETVHLGSADVQSLLEPASDAALPQLEPVAAPALSLEPEPAAPLGGAQAPGPPPTPAAGGGASDTNSRIQELLQEGDRASEAKEYQKAIDAWSRIFLIDIDHQEAARRIEQARKLKAEAEREIDQTFHEGIDHRDAGRPAEARTCFNRVLELSPQHLGAKEQLEQLDRPQPIAEFPAPVEEPAPEFAGPDPGSPDGDVYTGGPAEVPGPILDSAPEVQGGGAAKPQRSFLTVGAIVLLLVGGGGWLLYSSWGRFFPNPEEEVVAAAPRVDAIQKATQIRLRGNTAAALAELRKLEPNHPDFARAQVLIEQWQEDVEEPEDEGATVRVENEPDERELRREALLARARSAYAEREYLRAAKTFRAADALGSLEGSAADLYDDARRQLQPIAQQIDLFRQREWEMILPGLWRKLEEEPENRDVRLILADSYFNLGVRELRRGAPRKAIEHFGETESLLPTDEMCQRLLKFSRAYDGSKRDLLYDIYVGQLGYRR